MSQEEKSSSKRRVLKSVFLSSSIRRMEDLKDLYPTYVAKLLGINHARYMKKLDKPETFTINQIIFFAKVIDIDPQIIMNIILAQVAADKKKKGRPGAGSH